MKNRKILAPKGGDTRPTSNQMREALFNICQTYIEGADFLDLFAGSGAVGLEALSRGAARTTFVDNDRHCFRCIEQNLEVFGLQERGKVFLGDVLRWLENRGKKEDEYDIIYADPPYGEPHMSYGALVLEFLDKASILKKGGVLFIEEARSIKMSDEGVQTLELKSERRFGRSMLYQYEKH